MTEQDAKSKPIHEVWKRFEWLSNVVGEASHRHQNQSASWISTMNARLAQYKPEFDVLRIVLLERCELEASIKVSNDNLIEWSDGSDYALTSNLAKSLGSAWLFMAWELEQREREAKNG